MYLQLHQLLQSVVSLNNGYTAPSTFTISCISNNTNTNTNYLFSIKNQYNVYSHLNNIYSVQLHQLFQSVVSLTDESTAPSTFLISCSPLRMYPQLHQLFQSDVSLTNVSTAQPTFSISCISFACISSSTNAYNQSFL